MFPIYDLADKDAFKLLDIDYIEEKVKNFCKSSLEGFSEEDITNFAEYFQKKLFRSIQD
ncbi:hypothetical protein [endosymbiont of Acanthamoeba sp. UWC8]|uniref:hypothetical protein n=1 Tax=endosymbiont of Acanthamoeba sp. UWC8 TaxID=86106 RepID=UPI00130E83BD|nr:hypothetical protein [endosymbiont of Acanthamoeba sp. UWC8]